MKRYFVDTSAWFAFTNRRDPEHSSVKKVLRQFQGRLVTSNYVWDEAVTLCRYRLGHDVAVRIGRALLSPDTVDFVRLTAEDERAAFQLFSTRKDKQYSFTDCSSFVLMRRLGLDTAVALDDDFEQEGFEVVPDPG